MITFRDALFLASTKFRTRKVRNIFSACVMALGLVIILSFYSGTAAVMNLAREVFVDSTAGRVFVKTVYQPGLEEVSSTVVGSEGVRVLADSDTPDQAGIYPDIAQNPELYKTTYAGDGVTRVYHEFYSNVNEFYTLGGAVYEAKKERGDSRSLLVVDDIFLKDFILDGQTLALGSDGSVPVIVPKEYVLPGDYFLGVGGASKTQKELYTEFQEVKDKYLNTTFPLARVADSVPDAPVQIVPSTVNVRIVGFSPVFFAGDAVDSGSILISRSVYDATPALQQFFTNPQAQWMVAEMNTTAERDAFVEKSMTRMMQGNFDPSQGFTQPVLSRFDTFAEIIKFMRSAAYGVGGFLMVVSGLFLLSTLGKVINDSQKEIGVFRAIGARKRDVKKIYYMYAWILSTVAFIIALIISTTLIALASQRWGDSLYYQLLNNGINSSIEHPFLVFFGLNPLSIGVCYLITIIVGCIAAFLPVLRAARMKPIDVLRAL